MKVKTLSMMAAAAGATLLGSQAQGAFVGAEAELVAGAPANVVTVRIFGRWTNGADTLATVGGDPANNIPLFLEIDGGTLYNEDGVANAGVHNADIGFGLGAIGGGPPAFASDFDTFLNIGIAGFTNASSFSPSFAGTTYDLPPDNNTFQILTTGLTGEIINDPNSGYFRSGIPAQVQNINGAITDGNGDTLLPIANISVLYGDNDGDMDTDLDDGNLVVVNFGGTVVGVDADSDTVYALTDQGDSWNGALSNDGGDQLLDGAYRDNLGGGEFFVSIPAPGAMALLGLAGLTARRRRRG